MRTIRMALLGTALVAAAAAPALAQPAQGGGQGGPGPRGDRGPAALFNQIDGNKDGRVTWEESWVFIEQRFRAADPDNDGSLTQQEMANARLHPGARRAEGAPGPQHARMIGFVFRGLDANRDGVVTLTEIRPAAEARFRAFDANGDGAVTRDEVPNPPRRHRHDDHHRRGGQAPAQPG